jgi:hypothetical protein
MRLVVFADHLTKDAAAAGNLPVTPAIDRMTKPRVGRDRV